ncbi:unnamed protein product, partial [Prorocentrum cordatum]
PAPGLHTARLAPRRREPSGALFSASTRSKLLRGLAAGMLQPRRGPGDEPATSPGARDRARPREDDGAFAGAATGSEQSQEFSRLGSACPAFSSALSARKRAEQDAVLLANRIRLLRAEEENTRKKIRETEKQTTDILEARRRNEEHRLVKE